MAKSKRKAGVLMPVSALPGCGGIGSLGKNAYTFVDWLTAAGAKTWQILPLLPLSYGDSPYQACVSNGLNYYFIDPETLKSKGLLKKSDYCSQKYTSRNFIISSNKFRADDNIRPDEFSLRSASSLPPIYL